MSEFKDIEIMNIDDMLKGISPNFKDNPNYEYKGSTVLEKPKVLKRLVLGDIHGHWDNLKKIYDLEDPDEVIILGDYFDNFNGSDQSIYDCYRDILQLRGDHLANKTGDFIMLIGNHDFHYNHWYEKCSGYRSSMAVKNAIILNSYSQHLKFVYLDEVNNTLYSHAGVTKHWLKENLQDKYDKDSYKYINEFNHEYFKYTKKGGDICRTGETIYASPIWCRPDSLNIDAINNEKGEPLIQIVGHTHEDFPKCFNFGGYEMKCDLETLNKNIDDVKIFVMDTMPKYYMVESLDENRKLIKREIKQLQ